MQTDLLKLNKITRKVYITVSGPQKGRVYLQRYVVTSRNKRRG